MNKIINPVFSTESQLELYLVYIEKNLQPSISIYKLLFSGVTPTFRKSIQPLISQFTFFSESNLLFHVLGYNVQTLTISLLFLLPGGLNSVSDSLAYIKLLQYLRPRAPYRSNFFFFNFQSLCPWSSSGHMQGFSFNSTYYSHITLKVNAFGERTNVQFGNCSRSVMNISILIGFD